MKRFVLAAAAASISTFAYAQTAPNDVTFGDYGEIEVSLSGEAGDAERGLEVMVSRGKGNCIACHEVTALQEYPFHGEVGPMLDGAGDRWTEADLRGIVANAKNVFPESIMPAFYRTDGFTRPGDAYTGRAAEGDLDPLLTAQEIEDVVAYLMTLTD
ncbi:sulfur oxidation c-type cytochrome SoxX [Octadecabacter sp. CECT 8868]|uniref:sulfur oxidation c-type cytochrome SoxX n=1 Tax=Octadecabacter algicola TaxID=2909342 RepID=UPI001F1F04A5|nr:sulfur oxidation c-type cytochrome SoxX [Octadecabacter algicola]MCF2904136.1 sulfur oxidation c-type cytochrome SoxX [Octadecabacter algicola]